MTAPDDVHQVLDVLDVLEVLDVLTQAGVFLSLHEGGLRAWPRYRLTDELRSLIRDRCQSLIAWLHMEADEEAFEERAAIQQFDGGLPRAEAEAAARASTTNQEQQ